MKILCFGIVERLVTDDNIEIMEINYPDRECTRSMNFITKDIEKGIMEFCGLTKEEFFELPFKKTYRY